MKFIITLIALLFIQAKLNASDTTIVFLETKYSEIFELAKETNKPVFIYFHFNGCSGCLNMEKNVFVEKRVIDFFNQNFICYSVNISYAEGKETNKIYNIHGFPTFLFLDSDGNIVYEFHGPRTSDEFIEEAKIALEHAKQ